MIYVRTLCVLWVNTWANQNFFLTLHHQKHKAMSEEIRDNNIACKPILGYREPSSTSLDELIERYPAGTFGFYTEDAVEFEHYKEQLMREATEIKNGIVYENMWADLREKYL